MLCSFSRPLPLRCPGCGVPLRPGESGRLACGECGRAPGRVRGLVDLRVGIGTGDGWPAGVDALERALERLEGGRPFKATLEETREADLLLHVVDAASAEREEQRREVEGGIRAPRMLDQVGEEDVLG